MRERGLELSRELSTWEPQTKRKKAKRAEMNIKSINFLVIFFFRATNDEKTIAMAREKMSHSESSSWLRSLFPSQNFQVVCHLFNHSTDFDFDAAIFNHSDFVWCNAASLFFSVLCDRKLLTLNATESIHVVV